MLKNSNSKKIDILGISIDNYTVRESMLQLDTYLSSAVMSLIETVTMRQLLLARENPVIRECLSQADLCIIGDCEILSDTGNSAAQRMREVRDQDFLNEMIRRMVRMQKKIYLIAMTAEDIGRMKEFFLESVPKFSEVGSYALDACGGDTDAVVNEINGATPDVVISALQSPTEEEFVLSHKGKLGTCVWYGIGGACYQKKEGIRVAQRIQKLALRGRLRHTVSKYNQYDNQDRK